MYQLDKMSYQNNIRSNLSGQNHIDKPHHYKTQYIPHFNSE